MSMGVNVEESFRTHLGRMTGKRGEALERLIAEGNAEGEAALGNRRRARVDMPAGMLSGREIQVVAALADGRSTAEVAKMLAISAQTVKAHTRSVRSKLGAGSTLHAVVKCVRNGWV